MTRVEEQSHEMFAPEYDVAGWEFFFGGVEALMCAKSPLYRGLSRERMERVPSTRLILDDGTAVQSDPIEVTEEVVFDVSEAIAGGHASMLCAMDSAADQCLSQVMRGLFGRISDVCDAVGNTVDADGRISWDLIIEALEKIDIEFDEHGRHELTLVAHPDVVERFRLLGPATPEQQARINAVMRRKREESDARRRRRSLP